LTDRQTALDRQYDSAYARYLAQFTQLQSVQSSMSYNTSLFDALFSSNKD
jgi:flagellar hook-associated protein 2